MSIVFFRSARLWFRPPEAEDAELIQRWVNDPQVRAGVRRVFPVSLEAEREWIGAGAIPAGSVPTKVNLLFGLDGRHEPIGSAGLFNINWVAREAEWGILIGDVAQWGKGYGREVAATCVDYAFKELNLNRVTLTVNADNAGGIKAYEAAGFRREGLLREASYADGAYEDVIAMAILRAEWQAARAH